MERRIIHVMSVRELRMDSTLRLQDEHRIGESVEATVRDGTVELDVVLEVTRSWARHEQGVRMVPAGSRATVRSWKAPARRIAETNNSASAREDA